MRSRLAASSRIVHSRLNGRLYELTKPFLKELADDYGLGRVGTVAGIPEGSVNSNYLVETAKGRFLLRIDEVKGEIELKRELDLLSFLRKHSFPCPHPMQDRMGRYYRDFNLSAFRCSASMKAESLPPECLQARAQLERIGRTLGELHVIGKADKKGIDNRFSFERIADLYLQRARQAAELFPQDLAAPSTTRSTT